MEGFFRSVEPEALQPLRHRERVREVKGKEEQEAVLLKTRANDTYSCTLRISPEFIYGHNVRFLPSVPVVT